MTFYHTYEDFSQPLKKVIMYRYKSRAFINVLQQTDDMAYYKHQHVSLDCEHVSMSATNITLYINEIYQEMCVTLRTFNSLLSIVQIYLTRGQKVTASEVTAARPKFEPYSLYRPSDMFFLFEWWTSMKVNHSGILSKVINTGQWSLSFLLTPNDAI